jgi:hypothetical protein
MSAASAGQPEDPKDPRFRAYRAFTLGVYLVLTIIFCGLIIFSVYRSVLRMTPERPNVGGEVQSEAECLRGANQLFTELEGQRKTQGEQADVTHSDQRFLEFRVQWLTRKRVLEAKCALDSREKVKDAFDSLDRVLDLYTTASVQFSGAVGPSVDSFKQTVAQPR